MKPFLHYLNLGYALCKCRYCKQPKSQRKLSNTPMRRKVKNDIKKELRDE